MLYFAYIADPLNAWKLHDLAVADESLIAGRQIRNEYVSHYRPNLKRTRASEPFGLKYLIST